MPKPLFEKLAAICAIGFFCVLFGCVYGIHAKDHMFLLMSLLIGLCSLIRFFSLYHLVHAHHYLVLEGTCIKREPALLKRNLQILFQDTDGTEHQFTLDKGVKLFQGHYYRLYFRTSQDKKEQPFHTSNTLPGFLGFEELSSLDKNGSPKSPQVKKT